MAARRRWTSRVAWSMSVPSAKVTVRRPDPCWALASMRCTPLAPETAFSAGTMIACSMFSGEAPGQAICTKTTGKVMAGKRSTFILV